MGGRQLFLTSLLHTSRILPKPPGDLHPIVVAVYFSVSAVLTITINIIQHVCDIICVLLRIYLLDVLQLCSAVIL